MFPKRKSYSRWWGPLLGALWGILAAAMSGIESALSSHDLSKDIGFFPLLAMGAGIGTAGGLLVMLLDPGPKSEVDIDPRRSPTLSGNILCALSLLFFFMPFFNIGLSGFALCLNWRVKGWSRRLSWFGLLLGLVITSLIVWHWIGLANGS